jgi:glycosyltransferase involved in cell wall biosynthesis
MVTFFVPAWGFGGPVRLMYDYATWMAEECQSSVLTCDTHHDFSEVEVKNELMDGFTVRRYTTWFRSMAKRMLFLTSPRLLWDAYEEIADSRNDWLIHICENRAAVIIYAVIVRTLFARRVRLIHSAFGMLHYKKSWRRNIYDALWMKPFLNHIDLALAQNQHEADTYRELFQRYGVKTPCQIAVHPLHINENASEFQRPTSKRLMNDLRRKHGIPEDALVFLFLGRIHPAKGIMRTIEAFCDFEKHTGQSSMLLLVGRDDGEQQKASRFILENGLDSKIWIVNNVYEQRYEYYSLADCFVGFPTIFEETMLASVEALSCGTPIIVSREADLPFVEKEGAGFVIDFDLPTATKAMLEIASDRAAYSKRAFDVALRHYSSASGREQFLSLVFEQATRSRRMTET